MVPVKSSGRCFSLSTLTRRSTGTASVVRRFSSPDALKQIHDHTNAENGSNLASPRLDLDPAYTAASHAAPGMPQWGIAKQVDKVSRFAHVARNGSEI